MDNKVKIFTIAVAVLVLGIIGLALVDPGEDPAEAGKYDVFAQCLKDKGAIFYGTFWCPYCKAQKEMFGSSAKLLPYFECSTPDGRNQVPACTEKSIKSYPTWDFADGSRLTGKIPFQQLAEKTGCSLPAE